MEFLIDLFQEHRFNALIIIEVVILTAVFKKVFLTKLINKVEAEGYDKAIVTRHIMLIPYLLAFISYFLYHAIMVRFDLNNLDFQEIITKSCILALASIATYEQIKVFLRAYQTKKEGQSKETEVNK